MNSLILGNFGVSTFIPCQVRRTKQMGTNTRAAFLHMNYLVTMNFLCTGFADQCVEFFS